jgi:hypothetical protein
MNYHSRSNAAVRAEGMSLALLHRVDPMTYEKEFAAHPTARDYAGMTLLELARAALEENAGLTTRGLSKMELAGAALIKRDGGLMSSSDFPAVLANVMAKQLRRGYEAAPQTFRPFTRIATVKDFKEISRVQLGEAPQLEKVGESGEFKRGAMGEAVEKYRLATYGKIISITRQVLINDDLNAFGRIPVSLGVQAANLESDAVWYQLLKNAAMNDGVALFHATHANTGTGAISTASVSAGREAMSKQKGLDGVTVLNLEAAMFLVPKALVTAAEQFRGTLYPATTSSVVPDDLRKLGIISEPRLDLGVTFDGDTVAGSATQWYLAATPTQIDVVELAYLEGAQGLQVETRAGFSIDGIETKARLDLGVKVIDYRGLYRSSGV